jgi:hypothetical protein
MGFRAGLFAAMATLLMARTAMQGQQLMKSPVAWHGLASSVLADFDAAKEDEALCAVDFSTLYVARA